MTIHIKAGAKSGQRLILRGKGSQHPFNSNLPNGDIIIEIGVQIDPSNIIDPQNNIWKEVSLPWFDIITGTKITISSLDGPIAVMIPSHSQPDYDSGARGNLMLKLNPSYPDLTEEQLEYIKKVQEIQNG